MKLAKEGIFNISHQAESKRDGVTMISKKQPNRTIITNNYLSIDFSKEEGNNKLSSLENSFTEKTDNFNVKIKTNDDNRENKDLEEEDSFTDDSSISESEIYYETEINKRTNTTSETPLKFMTIKKEELLLTKEIKNNITTPSIQSNLSKHNTSSKFGKSNEEEAGDKEKKRNLILIQESNKACHDILNANTHYDVLGLKIDANDVLIKKAYKMLSYKFIPDNNPSQLAHEAFDRISLAFQSLTKSSKFSLKLNNRTERNKIDSHICFRMFINYKNIGNKAMEEFISPEKPPNYIEIKENKNKVGEVNFSQNNNNSLISINAKSIENSSSDNNNNHSNYSYLSSSENKKIRISKKVAQRLPDFMKDINYHKKEYNKTETIKEEIEENNNEDKMNLVSNNKENLNVSINSAGNSFQQKRIERIREKLDKKRRWDKFLTKIIPVLILLIYFLIQKLLEPVRKLI